MRALELILDGRPAAHVLMVGGDGISYGPARPDGRTWKEVMLDEVDLPAGRVHWPGRLPYRQYLTVLRYSRARIYLAVPFVLSWSLLEAMASACPVVSSATAPVQEVVEHDRAALLVDFFRHRDLADAVVGLLKDRAAAEQLARRARETIPARYDLRDLLPRQQALLMALAAGCKPAADFPDSPAAGR
jgi:glycosyltransferase involved in cell wall biosynthesis